MRRIIFAARLVTPSPRTIKNNDLKLSDHHKTEFTFTQVNDPFAYYFLPSEAKFCSRCAGFEMIVSSEEWCEDPLVVAFDTVIRHDRVALTATGNTKKRS